MTERAPDNKNNINKPGRTGISRIAWATRYSVAGIILAWKNEAAFRQETVLTLLMLPLALWLGESVEQRVMLVGSCIIVLIVELLNSAIEATIDRIGPEMHELSGHAKDMASAAVFFSLTLVVITWGMIAWERFTA